MQSGPTWLGKLAIALFIAACLYAAYQIFLKEKNIVVHGSPTGPSITLGIAYGTEKKKWLHWAAQQFAETADGKRIQIDLIPMGSLEGAQALTNGDARIHVWSPASSAYRDVFVQDWTVKYGSDPILKEEPLALSPMVFVFWKERYQAFTDHFGEVGFDTIAQALKGETGWQGIANKPEWGLFKFGHTRPTQSNSGLLTLVLMAYDFTNQCANLTAADIVDRDFQNWLREVEGAVSGLSHSTGTMMREMILKGPSVYDGLFVYENLAIDYLKNAEGRWGALQVVYPKRNLWNDNPYYIINAPWSDDAHREAARIFLDFLLSERIQKQSLTHGFRPGDPNIPVKTPDSPFTRYAQYGLNIDIASACQPPKGEVIHNLLATWQRSYVSH